MGRNQGFVDAEVAAAWAGRRRFSPVEDARNEIAEAQFVGPLVGSRVYLEDGEDRLCFLEA